MGLETVEVGELARPVAFAGCAGWLHPADGDVAVLLLSPWGFEALCMRRAWRMLADRLAQAGYPTLRFDYPGTGDSLGEDHALAGLDELAEAALAAGKGLKSWSDASRLVVIGQGLGAALAARVAPQLKAIGAGFLAPVVRGREYLRELSIWGITVAETMALTVEAGDGAAVAGCALPYGLKSGLAALDLTALDRAPAPKVLTAARAGRASDARLAARLEDLGCEVSEIAYEAYDLAVSNPTAARPPKAAIEAVADWLCHSFPAPPRPAALTAPAPVLETPEFVETAVRFGPGARLTGVICEPRRPRRGAAVLMLSAGADPHVGWARCNVDHARALARSGIVSLRMDAADVGDSAGLLTDQPVRLYDEQHIADAQAGIQWLEAQGLGPVLPVGRCSGAFAAFNAAARDERIRHIVLVNQLRYIWNRDGDFELASEKVGHYRRQVRNPAKLLARWIRGDINLDEALKKLLTAALKVGRAKLTGKAAERRRQIRDTFGGLQKRGVRVNLLISRDREAHEVFRQFFGAEGGHLKRFGDIHLQFLEGADHALTPPGARAALFELVREAALASPVRSVEPVASEETSAGREDLPLRPGVESGLLPT